MAEQAKVEFLGESVGQVAWLTPTPPRTPPSYTDTLDSGTLAGDVVVTPEELDRYTASLQEYVGEISANLDYNQAQLADQMQTFILGPQIQGVRLAVQTAGETSAHLQRTLMVFHEALSHDIAAVQAARQSYVGTDEFAALDISSAGGDT